MIKLRASKRASERVHGLLIANETIVGLCTAKTLTDMIIDCSSRVATLTLDDAIQ